MGRYSSPLAVEFADFAELGDGRILDVGCGPGAFTGELVRRVGAANVAAADPSEAFVAATRERHPGVDVRRAPAEELPFADDEFDAALAQLVVHFMSDPHRGAAEMARVTRPGGTVAACVWDHGTGRGPLSLFWSAAAELDLDRLGESEFFGSHGGQLEGLLRATGLADVEERLLSVTVGHRSFEDWWEPYTLGVGSAGAFLAGLEPEQQAQMRDLLRASVPEGEFELTVSAWAARGRVG